MRFLKFLFLLISTSMFSQITVTLQTPFEKGNGNQTTTYQQCINYYQNLDADFETIKVIEMGLTDSGEKLQVVLFDKDKKFNFDASSKKAVILINNGIHAGEPDGIDATMQFYRDLATDKLKNPDNVILVAIPVYNIGGFLNRNSTTRVNQNGPEEYGFRGNARNFDLNRDFIKSDTKNTKSFVEIYHTFNPDIFIDNHVSNGADYQYTLTYIMTEPKKLGTTLGNFMRDKLSPSILKELQQKKIETTPYVNIWKGTPENGFEQFFDSPRYATGYTSLFNSIGFVVETHMLKKYAERVKVTYEFMVATMNYTNENYKTIKEKRIENENQFKPNDTYTLKWAIDTTKVTKIPFLGYEGSYKKSDVTTGKRLFYDRTKPYKKEIPFLADYKSAKEIIIPNAYVIPQGFWPVIDLLKLNKIAFSKIKNDTIIEVESYKIVDYKTSKNAYEGHYPHNATTITKSIVKMLFIKGDYIVSTAQKGVKFLLETLEPDAVDSYFNWNFFDTILQQKEGYSEYVFEDLANDYLNKNPKLREQLEQKKKDNKAFAENPEAQLEWVHKNSIYYEKAHLQYPIYRVLN
ncbi:M14 family zinc carboxypeptidase [Flavobacterium sp.]|uniref:M14 family zinc carboxypeptidase n=1 Tax=Flavobacterium sp. TaxID=239 RepID=UPI0037515EDE